jgi:hypothetical protein
MPGSRCTRTVQSVHLTSWGKSPLPVAQLSFGEEVEGNYIQIIEIIRTRGRTYFLYMFQP